MVKPKFVPLSETLMIALRAVCAVRANNFEAAQSRLNLAYPVKTHSH